MASKYSELPEELKPVVVEKTDSGKVVTNAGIVSAALLMVACTQLIEGHETLTYLLYVVAFVLLVYGLIRLTTGNKSLYSRSTGRRVKTDRLYYPLSKESELLSALSKSDTSSLGAPSSHTLPLWVEVWYTDDASVMAMQAYKYEDYGSAAIGKVYVGGGSIEAVRALLALGKQ